MGPLGRVPQGFLTLVNLDMAAYLHHGEIQ
jgi:hypothetical protein